MQVSKIKSALLVLAFSFSSLGALANFGHGGQTQFQGQVSFVPAGTPVSVSLNQALGSEISRVGEFFRANLTGPLYAGGMMVAPPGSQVEGTVVSVEPAGRAGKPASMDLRLNTIITPTGQRIPVSASLDRANFNLQADGGRTSHMAKSTAVGAGAGALSGLVGSAIGGGKKGKSAAIGTGIGAGVGVLGGAIRKGQELIIQSGSTIPFVLDAPVQVMNAAPPVQQVSPEMGGFRDPLRQQAPNNPYLYD
jgi:hypothetical protein